MANADQAELSADASSVNMVDRKHYWNFTLPTADAEGRVTLISLIPGALYRLTDYSMVNDNNGSQVSQGLHRQARRNPRPGRYPGREAVGWVMPDSTTETVLST